MYEANRSAKLTTALRLVPDVANMATTALSADADVSTDTSLQYCSCCSDSTSSARTWGIFFTPSGLALGPELLALSSTGKMRSLRFRRWVRMEVATATSLSASALDKQKTTVSGIWTVQTAAAAS